MQTQALQRRLHYVATKLFDTHFGETLMSPSRVLTVCLSFFAACAHVDTVAGQENDVPANVPMESIFSNYSYPGIDWGALSDPKNDALLRACLHGATRSDLARLPLADLQERLTRLEKGKVIRQSDGRYLLNFPVVVGAARVRLASFVHPVAIELLPAVRQMIGRIKPLLNNDQDMLYHFTWSIMMDGQVAWPVVELQLKRILGKDVIDLNTCWWLYPNHPYRAGTNTYGDPSGALIISWHATVPPPDEVRATLRAFDDAAIISALKREPIPRDKITDKLRAFGFVGGRNRSRLFILDVSSPLVPAVSECSAQFAQLAMTHINVKAIARDLDAEPERATVIAYHELCYEILGILSASRELAIPAATTDNLQAVRSLVSFVPLPPASQGEQMEKAIQGIIQQHAGQTIP
jgi:hypothetical protein